MCTFKGVVGCAGWPSGIVFRLCSCIVQAVVLGECEVCTEKVSFPPALALSGTNLQLPLYYPP